MSNPDTTETPLTLTPAALAMAKKFLAEEADPAGKALRVGVETGGCTGFSYAVSIDARKSDDVIISQDEFEVVVDPVSLQFLKGVTVDYVDSIGQAGFKFDNPNAQSSCGCGMSFDV